MVEMGTRFFITTPCFRPGRVQPVLRSGKAVRGAHHRRGDPHQVCGHGPSDEQVHPAQPRPVHVIERLTRAPNKEKASIEIFAELVTGLKGICNGIHIVPFGAEDKVRQLSQCAKAVRPWRARAFSDCPRLLSVSEMFGRMSGGLLHGLQAAPGHADGQPGDDRPPAFVQDHLGLRLLLHVQHPLPQRGGRGRSHGQAPPAARSGKRRRRRREEVRLFHQAFLGDIRAYGRVHELSMMARYKMATRTYLDDMRLGWRMFVEGQAEAPPLAS